jgi:hypothetical protein
MAATAAAAVAVSTVSSSAGRWRGREGEAILAILVFFEGQDVHALTAGTTGQWDITRRRDAMWDSSRSVADGRRDVPRRKEEELIGVECVV